MVVGGAVTYQTPNLMSRLFDTAPPLEYGTPIQVDAGADGVQDINVQNKQNIHIKYNFQTNLITKHFNGYAQIEINDIPEDQEPLELEISRLSTASNMPTKITMNRKDEVHLFNRLFGPNKKHLATIKIKQMSEPIRSSGETDNGRGLEAFTDSTNSLDLFRSSPRSTDDVPMGSVRSDASGSLYRGGPDASQIYNDLQRKFNGFAETACNDLQNILDEAGRNVSSGGALVNEGTVILKEVLDGVDQYRVAPP